MQEILLRAGSFIAIIALGFTLRRIGFFKESDFVVLAKITIKITLPAAIITSFVGKEIDTSMLYISLIALSAGLLYMATGYILNIRSTNDKRAFYVLNLSGYNIGNFTLPFVQSFLGPTGVIITSIFDTGNAFICLGGAYSIASLIKSSRKSFFKTIAKTLLSSTAFICYLIMITMSIIKIPIPSPVISIAKIIGNANPFIAMLMIGVGFKLSANLSQIGTALIILFVRYFFATGIALVFFFLLPFSIEIRQTLTILAFSPIASAAPAYTAQMNGEAGLSSAVNSLSIICSIVIIVTLLSLML